MQKLVHICCLPFVCACIARRQHLHVLSLVFASELAHAESLASSNEYHPQAAQYSTVLLKTSAIYHIWYHMISILHVDSDS